MPMMLVSNPTLSPQDNEYNIFYSSLFINDSGTYYYIYIYIYICMYIGTICFSYYSCCFLSYIYIVWCLQLFIYCMVERRYTYIVSLLLSILLLLIVIYDGVGTYNETIIEDWYVDDDDVLVPVLSHNDNYCTFIPSSFVFNGGGGDIYMVQFVCDTI